MPLITQFDIPGPPVAKGRPRFSTRGGFAKAYTPAKTAAHEQMVRTCALAVFPAPLTGALRLEVWTYHAIPKSMRKADKEAALLGELRPISRPDADNLGKQIADALNGIAYEDDSQIVEFVAKKFYGIEPRTSVKLIEMDTL